MGDLTPVDNFECVPGLNDADRERVYYRNAEEFLAEASDGNALGYPMDSTE